MVLCLRGRAKDKVAGFDLAKLNRKTIPLLRRKLGIVFQDFNLLSDRTVEDNLRFVLEATNWKDEQKCEAACLMCSGRSG